LLPHGATRRRIDGFKGMTAMVLGMARDVSHEMKKHKLEMDRGLAAVMPDDWIGHARIKINNADLSNREYEFAKRLTSRLMENGSVDDASQIGEKAVNKAKSAL